MAASSPSAAPSAAEAAAPSPLPPLEKPARVVELEGLVAADPYDVDSWTELLRRVTTFRNASPSDARAASVLYKAYDGFLAVFPTAGLYWQRYATACLDGGDYAATEAVLARALQPEGCRNTDTSVCVFYIDFVVKRRLQPALQRVTDLDKSSADSSIAAIASAKQAVEEARAEVLQAFDFALDQVGVAIGSTTLWRRYIDFLKDEPTDTLYAQQRRREALRQAYKRVTSLAIHNVEEFWVEYTEFEKTEAAQPAEALKLIQQHQSTYATALAAYKEKRGLWAKLTLSLLARPPQHREPRLSADAAKLKQTRLDEQVLHWQEVLAYEKRNTQRLAAPAFAEYMRFVYAQCLNCMRHYPEFWLDMVRFEQTSGDLVKSHEALQQALEIVPSSHLLSFAAADFFESQGMPEKATAVFEALLEANPAPIVYIMYQRFARRQPDGMKAARKVFTKARNSDVCSPEVFIASAHMELYANRRADVARKVLEHGRKRYPDDAGFAAAAVDLMVPTMDDNNTRVLFESILSSLPAECSKPVWDRYLQFEHCKTLAGGGEAALLAVSKLEERRRQVLGEPSDYFSAFTSSLHRYHCFGLSPSGAPDTEFFRRQPWKGKDTNVPLGAVAKVYTMPVAANGASAGAGAGVGVGAGVGAGAGAGSSRLPTSRRGGDVPGFLQRLLSLIPKPYLGHRNRPEFVIRRMRTIAMPPPPAQESRSAGDYDSHGTKRGRDEMSGAPSDLPSRHVPRVDVYRARQQRQLRDTGALNIPRSGQW